MLTWNLLCTSYGSTCTNPASHFHFPLFFCTDDWTQPPCLWSGLFQRPGATFLLWSFNFWWLWTPPTWPICACESPSPGESLLVATESALPFPLRHGLDYTTFILVPATVWVIPSSSLTWQRKTGWFSIFTSFFAWKSTWTFVGFSVVVSEPFLGWTVIMELILVAESPKESTEKLSDKKKKSVLVII